MDTHDNIQTADCPPSHVVVALTKYGRARTVTPYATGLYCKLSIGRIDGEYNQETMAQTTEDLPPELYNAIYSSSKTTTAISATISARSPSTSTRTPTTRSEAWGASPTPFLR